MRPDSFIDWLNNACQCEKECRRPCAVCLAVPIVEAALGIGEASLDLALRTVREDDRFESRSSASALHEKMEG